jgi:hypothetical protein
MSFSNVEVKITVKVDGQRVGRRKITRDRVSSLEDGAQLLSITQTSVQDLAKELRAKAGV